MVVDVDNEECRWKERKGFHYYYSYLCEGLFFLSLEQFGFAMGFLNDVVNDVEEHCSAQRVNDERERENE